VSGQVTVALIAAGASVVVSGVTAGLGYVTKRRQDEQLAQLNDALEEARAERDAQRDYRYEARKRLYAEFQPLFFQLVELCESAYNRVLSLAQASRDGYLGPGPGNWLEERYYMLTTVHRFVAPLVLFRLAQRRLTFVDLSADDEVRKQYAIAKALQVVFNASFDLAKAEPAIAYLPHDPRAPQLATTQPAVYERQHVVSGQLDQMIDALTVRESDGAARCMTYGEFETAFVGRAAAVQPTAILMDLFDGFRPDTRPVLWRVVLAEAHVYRSLMRTFESESGTTVPPWAALHDEDRLDFDWRPPGSGTSFEEAVDVPLGAVAGWLSGYLTSLRTQDEVRAAADET